MLIRSTRRRSAGIPVRAAVVCAGVWILAASAPAGDLIPLLPRDTLAAVAVTDLGTFKERWESTSLGMAAKDPRLEPLLKPAQDRIQSISKGMLERWNLTGEEVLRTVPGSAALFNTRFEWVSLEVYEFDMCFMAEVGEHRERARALVERLLEKTPVDAHRSRYTFQGESVYEIRYTKALPPDPPVMDWRTGTTVIETPLPGSALSLVEDIPIVIQYAFVDKYLLVCEGRNEPIRKMISAIRDPAERLETDAGYRRLSEAAGGEPSISVWLAAGRAWKLYADHQKDVLAEQAKQEEESPGFKPPDLKALGLQDLGGLLVRLGLSKAELSLDLALEWPKAPKGVPALLGRPGQDNPLKTAQLCPANITSYSSFLYDGAQLWAGIRDLMLQFAPQVVGVMNMQIGQMNREFGIDLERGLIGSLGGEIAMYRRKPPSLRGQMNGTLGAGSMTFLIGLRDGNTFRQNHERLFQGLTREPYKIPIEKSTYLTYDIWTFKRDPDVHMPTVPAWSLNDGYLIISTDSEEIPGILRAWAGKAEKPLADGEEFRAGVQRFGSKGRLTFSYTPAESIVETMQTVLSFVPLGMSEGFEFGEKATDASVREALARYFGPMIDASYLQPGVLSTHSRLRARNP